jgi:hypothetical protein
LRTEVRRWRACRTTADSRWDPCEPARNKGRRRNSVVLSERDVMATFGATVLAVDAIVLLIDADLGRFDGQFTVGIGPLVQHDGDPA